MRVWFFIFLMTFLPPRDHSAKERHRVDSFASAWRRPGRESRGLASLAPGLPFDAGDRQNPGDPPREPGLFGDPGDFVDVFVSSGSFFGRALCRM